MSDLTKTNLCDDYKDVPYFELVEIAEKERDLEKRKALFELANKILERIFMKYATQSEQKSFT